MITRTKPARGHPIRTLLAFADAEAEVRRLTDGGESIMDALDAVSKRAGIKWGSLAFDTLAARCGIRYSQRLDLYLTAAEEHAWGR